MTLDTAIVLAAIVLALVWPVHQQLELRALRHALRRQRDQLAQHRRAIVQLQGAATQPPTSVGQPMASVTGQHRTIGAEAPACVADRDPTLRLHRPPAVTDVEHVLTQSGRALTATEIATHLGRQPWDLLGDIDRAMAAGRIRTVPGHTAGRTAYQLADTTHRMPHGMSVLPGLVQ